MGGGTRQQRAGTPPHPQALETADSNRFSTAGTTRNRKVHCFPAAQVTSSAHHETSTARTVESRQTHSFPGEVIPQRGVLWLVKVVFVGNVSSNLPIKTSESEFPCSVAQPGQ